MEFTNVDVTSLFVLHPALVVFPVGLPATLIDRPIDVDHLADTIFDEKLVLTEINVSIRIQQFADRATVAIIEFALEDNTLANQQTCHAMELVILEASSVLIAIRHNHLTLVPLVSLPNALKG